jgi:ribonuclease HII
MSAQGLEKGSAMLAAGVDDAGRGSVIGPLVIAGILIKENDIDQLVELGVKDSKQLSPNRREQMAKEIKNLVPKYHVIKLSPAEIDTVVKTGRKLHKLNRLEAQTMARVLMVLKPEIAYVDASDVVADRFGIHVKENLDFSVEIISENKADIKYPVVSAASIIAKVERDASILKLKETYGDFGCGYPTDSKTLEFLEELIGRHGAYPDFVRRSWKTAKRMKQQVSQTKLG